MDRQFYSIGQFAQKAAVSVRTLQYYDKEGLLSPSRYSESGYRLYTDEDLMDLQYILGLKFLGFSLEEIKELLQSNTTRLQRSLTQQKALMREKRRQLDLVVKAIEETEKLLRADQTDWESITQVIQVIQMTLQSMGDLRLPFSSGLNQYENQVNDLVDAYKLGDSGLIQRLRQNNPLLLDLPEIKENTEFTIDEARSIVAYGYGFESWEQLVQFVEQVTQVNSPVAQFESAVDAVISGDAAKLESLLRENPLLVRFRSTRKHHATLLHYVGANGFEGYRQKTPKNAVQIAEILLKAGAEVDAVADIYHKDTTLSLVATSAFTAQAGVQIALMKTLIEHGADIDGGPEGSSIVNACLANGRPEAADFLAKRGARLDLEGTAGVGRLDLVRSFFGKDGSLKANATKEQMESGFGWACEYGHTSVVEFLLDNGVNVGTMAHGMTGLHWAVVGGRLETIKFLLKRKAPLEVKNRYGGTVLDQAIWSATHSEPGSWPNPWASIIRTLIEAGADVHAYPGMREDIDRVLSHETECL